MSRAIDGILSWFWIAIGVGRAAAGDVGRHWVMASFSLVAGFGVWFAIQDVENPRVSDVVNLEAGEGIPIEARNVPEGYLFEGESVTRLTVEARDRDLEDLTADDFEAWVDLSRIDPEVPTDVEVNVRSRRNGVRAIEADPPVLRVELVRAEVRDNIQVQVNRTGALPDGYELDENDIASEPGFVKVTGTPAQIANLDRVEIDVDLSGRRDDPSTYEGDLVARTASGSPLTVRIDPPRAKVTMEIKQTFSQQTLPVEAPITGHPAAGYEIVRIVYEPRSVVVSGSKADVDALTKILVDPVDIGGATTDVSQTRQVRIPNIAAQPTTVLVRIEIRRDECDLADSDSGCATATFTVGVTLQPPPAGLTYEVNKLYITQVRVSGSLTRLQELSAADFVASASLATGTAGTASYTVAVVPPADVRVDSVDPISVTLVASQ
ncbi:MAG: CdaR family protein [Dehalococcoidia bacterium]